MNIEELFQRLSYGPLLNLAAGTDGAGGITEKRKPSIINYANEALLRLHTRFVLIERELILQQVDGISDYVIDPQHTYTASLKDNPPQVVPYIRDSKAKPFLNDLIKIMAVFGPCGDEYPLNDDNACTSLFTPQVNVLQVPCPAHGCLLHVMYQARHKELNFRTIDLKQEITLPFALEEAFVSYVAAKVYSHMNGQENIAKAAELLGLYEVIVSNAIAQDLVNSSSSKTTLKLCERGFV
jgi:hypothetical protein